MASTSTSSIQKSFKYDVFLSFRGEDTRNNFVSHLYKALEQHGIQTYKDDEKIKKGKTISDELIRAIEDSRFYVIVFSKNYASSSWCLDELVKIMECKKKMNNQPTAYPVFFDVEPTEVRKQSGAVGAAFTKHGNNESAGKWREALNQAADLAGWELKNTLNGDEAKLVQKIVEEISLELRFINSGVDENLIGMKTRIDNVVSSLELGVDDVRMIGIKGMGGAGKTTLARAIYEHISYQFEGCSFVENVREKSTPSMSGLNLLQKQVLSDVLSDQGINVSGVLEGKSMLKKKMCGRKVLIVLDDVDKIEQLMALAGDHSWFKPGSRIIITTRDAQVLIAHKVNLVRDVHLLDDKEAMRLFSRHAFGREIPVEGYKELSEQVVRYAAGLPLTSKVLGSFLCGKDDLDWKDALERLETIPLNETMKVLELSYIDLEEDYKEIFLDVACILKGWRKDNAIRALESCGFRARIGLRVLELKSLITISEGAGYLGMHDHIEEMGKNIVRRPNPNNPERHSRLWITEEIVDILANNKGTQATECITLDDPYGWNFEILMNGFANMKELRFLHVYGKHVFELWKYGEEKPFLKLRFLKFTSSGLGTLDLSVAPNLETLILERCDDLRTLDLSVAPNLETLILERCDDLRTLDLSVAPNLESLILESCHDLRTLDLSVAPNLETLILEDCHKLVEVHFQVTPNLKELRIFRCYNLVEKLHMPECPKLVNLDLSELKLRTLDLSVAPNLETLILEDCHKLVEVHFQVTPNLKELHICKCRRLEKLHMPAECPKLRSLDLSYLKKLRTLHLGVTPNLETLILEHCYGLVEVHFQVTPNLKELRIYYCRRLEKLHMSAESPKLRSLDLCYLLELRTLHLGVTPNLETLRVSDCADLVELQIPAECPKLVNLDLSYLAKLRTLDLSVAPNLETLILGYCYNLVEVHFQVTPNLKELHIYDCKRLEKLHMAAESPKLRSLNLSYLLELRTLHLGVTPNLETLRVRDCADLVELQIPAECLKLVNLDLSYLEKLRTLELSVAPNLETLILAYSYNLVEVHFQVTPNLKELHIYDCNRLEKLHMPAESPKLRSLNLSNLKLRTLHLGITPNLECLRLYSCIDMVELHMPAESPNLKELFIEFCTRLEKLHLGVTPNLETLRVRDCADLVELQIPAECPKLVNVDLSNCIRVAELPEEVGRLECLKELDITGTGIRHLPQSIFRVKGLQIVGSRWLLESCGFTSEIITSDDETFCYI